MYENCMLILGLEGVKLHGSTGEQILCLRRGAVNPIQLQYTFSIKFVKLKKT